MSPVASATLIRMLMILLYRKQMFFWKSFQTVRRLDAVNLLDNSSVVGTCQGFQPPSLISTTIFDFYLFSEEKKIIKNEDIKSRNIFLFLAIITRHPII